MVVVTMLKLISNYNVYKFTRILRASSSVVERSIAVRMVIGSNPVSP